MTDMVLVAVLGLLCICFLCAWLLVGLGLLICRLGLFVGCCVLWFDCCWLWLVVLISRWFVTLDCWCLRAMVSFWVSCCLVVFCVVLLVICLAGCFALIMCFVLTSVICCVACLFIGCVVPGVV